MVDEFGSLMDQDDPVTQTTLQGLGVGQRHLVGISGGNYSWTPTYNFSPATSRIEFRLHNGIGAGRQIVIGVPWSGSVPPRAGWTVRPRTIDQSFSNQTTLQVITAEQDANRVGIFAVITTKTAFQAAGTRTIWHDAINNRLWIKWFGDDLPPAIPTDWVNTAQKPSPIGKTAYLIIRPQP